MPKAQLPHTFGGWIAAAISSMVGFIAGLFALNVAGRWFR